MEFYLSKIFKFFIDPLNILFFIIFVLIFIIFFNNSKKLVNLTSKLFLILFLFFGYTPLSNFLLNKIEDQIKSSQYPVQQLTGIIVMGGSFNSGLLSEERNEASINGGAERLIKALEIYKKNPKILILYTGFSSEIYPKGWNESQIAKKFFFDQGVKNDNLIFENKSRNTFENIIFSKDLINKNKGVWGLITSASHMPRAFFSFKKQGIILEPIIVDYQTGTSKMFWIDFNIYKGLSNWSAIFYEVIGLTYYKVTNKI
jgi:uncharacterized SAM-binding protein YcdF (DUF218 family)